MLVVEMLEIQKYMRQCDSSMSGYQDRHLRVSLASQKKLRSPVCRLSLLISS